MQSVLVTGAGGYIGCVLVPKLIAKGYWVRAVDRYFFGADKLTPHENLEVVKEDSRKLTEGHFRNIDCVIDLVAVSNDSSGELFSEATWQINHDSRANTARLAKYAGVKRYILPSSCSIYGFQEKFVDEAAATNPLTVYARANESAENDTLRLADQEFVVTVMRQATVFGYSPRMRFDLAINGMTYGAYTNRVVPLMRDGSQYRPMLHVEDTTDVMMLLLKTDPAKINGEILNVGSAENTYQLGDLGKIVASAVGENVGESIGIEWYGEPDHRSYCVSFEKIELLLGWKASRDVETGVAEIAQKLQSGDLSRTDQTLTLNWYQELAKWHHIIKEVELYGGILDI